MAAAKKPLAFWVLIGMVVGIVAGCVLVPLEIGGMTGAEFANAYIKPFGTIFLNLLKFVVVPVVLLSIAAGVISMNDLRKVGGVGARTVVFYLFTTALAVTLALVLASLARSLGIFQPLSTEGLEYAAPASQGIMATIVAIFPSNAVEPLVSATMLQVIVIALLVGYGVLAAGEKGVAAARIVESFNEVFLTIVNLILKLSPIGVACLICPVVATNGPSVLGDLLAVTLVVYTGYILHMAIVYAPALKGLGKISPVKFFKGLAPAMVMAFSSASSVGTLPVNMECVQKMGVRKDVASFVLPLGATINMDGTAIYQGVCCVFIATCFGIDLTLGNMVTIVLTATLASIGTAGVPGAGMVMLTMVLQSVGVPVEGIALVAGIDRILDMGRTVVNITGDAVCSTYVSRVEAEKDAAKEEAAPIAA